ncbi:1,4-dihydroxy-2-naphthoate polyprenyltransferase [Reichenbachiella carrageenanivorans]|uniref:1,4-dihydroxy-2-naphthoate octaprenyltransferase n=1 Tax=Reichenbachiella carrageenanivorans TaxID=2979869 RepID=A0ABY6D1X9_9BACT|nr:1,4-dihydroxy-2-naphthoate polyprenyltransferase [Reichenbachiella carrageenanivorans]UXX79744.1 1,4-dihydroxy-2-naphthoate polyprenyltransferase [Reichenbachiella carrageenanivorans]
MGDSKIKHWLEAFRLRTLPLALSSILMGNFLAQWKGMFDWCILGLAVSTTVFLQILSNLANDYGDSVHGADSVDRQGPSRAVQTGVISKAQMKIAMIIFAVLSLVSGLFLLGVAFADHWLWVLIFLLVGVAAIYAAITYTAGSNPYGYRGLGDISVFIFFGVVGVFGSYFLQTHQFDWAVMLPAISCGLLATGVLNVNNIRDIESDEQAGKISIPVRIGRDKAVKYHFCLLGLAMLSSLIFAFSYHSDWMSFLFVLSFPLIIRNGWAVKTKRQAKNLDPFLKQLALTTLFFVILFGVGLIL